MSGAPDLGPAQASDIVATGTPLASGRGWIMRLTATQATLALLCVLTLANWLIHPNFLGPGKDWLGDFLKLTLSYPGADKVHSDLIPVLVENYKIKAHTDGAVLQADGTYRQMITHFHEPPLATLVPLLSVRLMLIVDPFLLYLGLALSTVAYAAWAAASAGRGRLEKGLLAAIVVIAYPTLFMLDRGNLFAGLTNGLIIHAVVLSLRDRRPWLSAVLLAVAINLRPNLVVFLLPVVAFASPWRWRLVPAVIAGAVTIFFGALAVDHAIYPDYSLAAFRHGLQLYSTAYVAGNDGIINGSSLFAPLKLWFGYSIASVSSLLIGALCGAGAVWLSFRQADRAVICFLVCAASLLGLSTFGDYHLLIFILPLLAALVDGRPLTIARVAVLTASALVIAPKNGWFWQLSELQFLSYQVWLNPFAVLTAAAICAWPGGMKRTVVPPGRRSALPA